MHFIDRKITISGFKTSSPPCHSGLEPESANYYHLASLIALGFIFRSQNPIKSSIYLRT